jgi:hypothetical protein
MQPLSHLPSGASVVTITPRSVSFFMENEVVLIPLIDDLSNEEIENTWYDFSEYARLKSINKTIVKMMKSGKYKETAAYSFRGLEYRISEGLERQTVIRSKAREVLLDEQQRQRQEKIQDAETLAKVMHEATRDAVDVAIEWGRRDLEAVKPTTTSIREKDDALSLEGYHSITSLTLATVDTAEEDAVDAPIPQIPRAEEYFLTNDSSHSPREKSSSRVKKFWRRAKSNYNLLAAKSRSSI